MTQWMDGWIFCHNGAIQQFSKIRRKILNQLTDEAYNGIQGTTDSEVCFALILTNLAKDGHGQCPYQQRSPYGHERLYHAVKRTIRQLEHVLQAAGIADATPTPSRMNFALSDGETVVCSRFCDKYPQEPPPSLYYCYGDAQQLQAELLDEDNASTGGGGGANDSGNETDDTLDLTRDEHRDAIEKDLSQQTSLPGKLLKEVDPASSGLIISSDPLVKSSTQLSWHRMAANSILCYTRGEIPRLYHLNVGGAKRPEDYAFFMVDL
eukprot:scaffold23158_cov176-Amphora_coffeaeformis.AAC.1